MLTVAPSGSTKLLISLLTPMFSSTHSLVIGSVADRVVHHSTCPVFLLPVSERS